MGERFTYEFIEQSLNANRLGSSEGGSVSVSTDSRTITDSQLFIALKGLNFDAHDYLEQAIKQGVKAVVISDYEKCKGVLEKFNDVTAFVVEDTLKALGDLAYAWRVKQNPKVYAVTGSNGKTTTKELLASILKEAGGLVKTEGNLNNLIGLPLTVLKLKNQKQMVLEMGMSELGEIDRLAKIAVPDVGIITNVNPAHLETLGSLENIAKAKGELFDNLTGDNWAVVNLDNQYTKQLGKKCKAQKITVSLIDPLADVFARNIVGTTDGFKVEVVCNGESVEVFLPLLGRHNVSNMLVAMAAASVARISPDVMVQGIAKCVVPGRRLKVRKDLTGFTLIDDCYNANPSSMAVALELMADIAGTKRKVAILGDMLELGKNSEIYHKQTGSKAAECGVSLLCAFGQYSSIVTQGAIDSGVKKENCLATENFNELEKYLQKNLKSGDVLLVKGSRGMRLERVVNTIENFAKE